MKIIIVGPAHPLRGGIAHHTALLYQELSKRHSVEIVTFKRQYPKLLFPGKTQKETGGELLRVPTEQLVDSINPFNWISVGIKIRSKSPDLIIFAYSMPFFGPCYGTIAAIARWRKSTKMLFLCHNIVPHEHRAGDMLFTRFAFWQADCFIVQSESVERDLLQFWPNVRYKKVPMPVFDIFGGSVDKQEARARLGIQEKKVLLFFGIIRAYKGLSVLLEAMRMMREREYGNDILLLIVGEFYEDDSVYHRQVKELNLEKHVRFTSHYIPQTEVAQYFCAADVLVLPYLSATQSAIVQTAYNFDKPVITTNVGGLGEVVIDGKTGFVVTPNDPRALSLAIERYFVEERETEFTANVKREKKKYSWENMAASIEDLMR
jgi:glycosyltransferase involved in cell wall biosynthesis